MSHALLLVPDFLLILCGFVLCRWTALNRSVWDGVERLVYYLLFPVLLFNSILSQPLQPGATLQPGRSAASAVVACGIAAGLCAAALARRRPRSCMPRARRPRSASIPSSRWRWPSAWPGRRAWPGWRC